MSDRPNPLGEVASKVGVAWAGLAGLVGALVTFGVLSGVQGNAIAAAGEAAPTTITALGTVIAGVMPIIAGLVAAFRTVAAGKEHVTPVSDPRDNSGAALVPDTGSHHRVDDAQLREYPSPRVRD